jgi:hypothetical protein
MRARADTVQDEWRLGRLELPGAGSGLTARGAPVTLTWSSRGHGGRVDVWWRSGGGTVVLAIPRLLLRTFRRDDLDRPAEPAQLGGDATAPSRNA